MIVVHLPLGIQVDAVNVDSLVTVETNNRAVVNARLIQRIAAVDTRETKRGRKLAAGNIQCVIDHGCGIAAVANVLDLSQQREVGTRLPEQLGACREYVLAAEIPAITGHFGPRQHGSIDLAVLVVAVALLVQPCETKTPVLGKRHVESDAGNGLVEGAVLQAHVEAGLVEVRALGPHDHGTRRRVLAEQRALRPAQHFDGFDVERFEELGLYVRHHEVVDQYADLGDRSRQ